jgi:hypothetical protein
MPNNEFRNDTTVATGQTCSHVQVEQLKDHLAGYQAELQGHLRDGHTRAHLGRSFGRPEGEIREDIDRVTQELVNCNDEYR